MNVKIAWAGIAACYLIASTMDYNDKFGMVSDCHATQINEFVRDTIDEIDCTDSGVGCIDDCLGPIEPEGDELLSPDDVTPLGEAVYSL